MKFVFRRKYTVPFMLFLLLAALCFAFYYFGPRFITNQNSDFFRNVLLISLVDSLLVVMFITGLHRVNYFLYHDHLLIKRSFFKPIRLNYTQIKKVNEVKNDKVFLIFGNRPSFKLKYETEGRIKNYRIRLANHELFKLVLENEKKISITSQELNTKKVTS